MALIGSAGVQGVAYVANVPKVSAVASDEKGREYESTLPETSVPKP